MAHYTSRSLISWYILEIARTHERGIAGLEANYADPAADAPRNWRVTRIDAGPVDPERARQIVDLVVASNGGLVMVDDDDPRNGQVVH